MRELFWASFTALLLRVLLRTIGSQLTSLEGIPLSFCLSMGFTRRSWSVCLSWWTRTGPWLM